MSKRNLFVSSVFVFALVLLVLSAFAPPGQAFESPEQRTSLQAKQFFRSELYISSDHQKLDVTALRQRSSNAAVESFLEAHGPDFLFFMDPRSGTLSNLIGSVPLIPGTGIGNSRTLRAVSAELGRPVGAVDERVVEDLVRALIVSNEDLIGINTAQLGTTRVAQVTENLWQISIPQEVNGVPVRHGRVAATINHGNLVLLGTESWGNVSLDTRPTINAEQALSVGFAFAEGTDARDEMWQAPTLEIVPYAPSQHQSGDTFVGPVGQGYGHKLVWSFGFRRPPGRERWEVLVDAHTTEVISLQDTNRYATKEIVGGAYPLTSTEICPTNETCGTMQSDQPMPFADTGQPPPNDYTNSAGRYEYTGGQATTTLDGKFVRVNDVCGFIEESTTEGGLDLGGVNGEHDCTSSGASPGNTAASRTTFYELNKLIEMAKGWLPNNPWLNEKLTANVNITDICNATYDGGTVNFYRSGGGCRNSGEIAAIIDHEWGHGLDNNDANGFESNSGEAYADIVAVYRLRASCVAHGFLWTKDQGCGETSDGTGFNVNESASGTHCVVDCSGGRDVDWAKHVDQTPDTPQNFVCDECGSGAGLCGGDVGCVSAPSRQAAWDFVARDLQAAPNNYDANTAFIVANKLFYQGSGNIGAWHACSCPNLSNGCGASNAYMQWLAADDDNGNVVDGTPHMVALERAFGRHNIACNFFEPLTGGCDGAPTAAPSSLSIAVASVDELSLEWNAVPKTVEYRVFRTEGYAGCEFGKALIATVSGTSYTDSGLAPGREYSYVVQAVGSTGECFGPVSECLTAAPNGPDINLQSYNLDDDCLVGGLGSGNGRVEPGEDVVLTVNLHNDGTATSTGMTARLSTASPGATVTQALSTYPDLAVGEAAGSPFSFTVDTSVPCGSLIVLDLETSSNEGVWTDAISLNISGMCHECSVPAPGTVTGLGWPAGTTSLEWSEASTTSFYNLYRGIPEDLPHLLDETDDSCRRLTTAETTTGDVLSETPAVGSFYWYLVTPATGGGEGSAGDSSFGPRVRNGDEDCP